MKKVIEVSLIVIAGVAVYYGITQLPNFFPRELKTFSSDESLRQAALRSLTSMPKTYEGVLKLTDTNPHNPLSEAKISLGKRLFNDKLLSKNRDISCASCHQLALGGDDNLPTAIGHNNQKNPFHLNTPTVLNASLYFRQFWDGRAKNVEEQAKGPIQAPFEMNMQPKEIEKRLKEDSYYVEAFEALDLPITFDNTTKAIAAYERTLVTRGAFDDFLEGDDNALSPEAKKGLAIFITRGCKGCHAGVTIGSQSIQKFPLRSFMNEWFDFKFVENKEGFFPKIILTDHTYPFKNSGQFKGKNEEYRFKVPSLRNVIRTAPYFHNGEVKELKEAVRIMGKYQLGQFFTDQELDQLVAFLKSLDGNLIEEK